MSDIKRVAGDTRRRGENAMNVAVIESYDFLSKLTLAHHRGRGDTLSAARDRAAKAAGVPRSYAKRIWDRYETMRDVSGENYRRLRAAYEASCEFHEERAREYRAERRQLYALDNSGGVERRAAGSPGRRKGDAAGRA